MQTSNEQDFGSIQKIFMKNNNNSKHAPEPQQEDDEVKKKKESPQGTLTASLQMLKISHDSQISKTAFKLIEKATIEQTKIYGYWIMALNAIADSCLATKHILSLSEIYDFLTVAVVTNIENEKRRRTKTIDDIIFRIYRDIMANYQSLADALKIAYPKIIVDIIAILATGIDTEGKKIPLYNIESYYQTRKLNISSSTVPTTTTTTAASTAITTAATASSISAIQEEEEEEEKEEKQKKLVENLNLITGRSKKALESSLANLQPKDIRRLRDLCTNYNKLEKYCELLRKSDNNNSRFRDEIQKELGRQLTYNQLQRAANSIRKARVYIENVLDGKFVPHGSYGINHIKHNLEYGYQIIGIMEPGSSRRRKGVKGIQRK
jgi:hypothetical protein